MRRVWGTTPQSPPCYPYDILTADAIVVNVVAGYIVAAWDDRRRWGRDSLYWHAEDTA